MPRLGAEFYTRIPETARILVLDLGFLGDTVHLIPALWAVRRALPRARLEVMVAEHVRGLLALCPWLDAVLGYPRHPRGPRWHQDFGRVRALRAARYDVIINLNGSDRSSLLTRAAGAPLRLGRTPHAPPWFWKHCFTDIVAPPRGAAPVFRQHLAALRAAGFPLPEGGSDFPIGVPEVVEHRLDELLGGPRPFAHVSPFATQDEKELPAPALAAFLNAAHAARPDLAWVLSAAPNDRERAKLAALKLRLGFEPWRVFAGELSLVELAGLIRRARLHLGGDSGSLHVALMAGTPTLSWWRDYAGRVEWQPAGPHHAGLVGRAAPEGLQGIALAALLAELEKLLPR